MASWEDETNQKISDLSIDLSNIDIDAPPFVPSFAAEVPTEWSAPSELVDDVPPVKEPELNLSVEESGGEGNKVFITLTISRE